MSKRNETASPLLRFKSYNKYWEKVQLKEVSNYFNGGSFENNVVLNGKYELITLKSIDVSGNLVCSEKYINSNVQTLGKDTLVMILSEQAPGLIGITARIPLENKYVLNQRVAEIRPNKNINSYFLSLSINRNQKYFSKYSAGTKVQNISKPNVRNYSFFIPDYGEQNKIAEFLSSVDKKIQLLEKKKEQLELYKKGVMQKIFSREVRFKDENGNSYPDWEEKKLEDCIISNKKSKIQVNEVSENDKNEINKFPFFTSGERVFYSDQYLIDDENIFMSTGGRATVKYYNGQCSFSTDTYSFKTTNQYSVRFIFFFLQRIINRIEAQYFYGSGLKHLDKKGFSKYKLYLPTLKEQKKIADFLSAIDNKIDTTSTQIDKTKEFKKGLLQQMFV